MRIEPLPLAGLHLVVPEPIEDDRGFFARSFSREAFEANGLDSAFSEWSISYNRRKGTLRGLHMQAPPHTETKLVQCVRGAIFDVAVDLRRASPTFGQWHAEELSAENRRAFYIPQGFAHGFQTLSDDCELIYHISEPYRAGLAVGVRWDDPDIAVAWPEAEQRIMSTRDAALPSLREAV
ncbi:dTDP-4-dehydrorhamnose 3,5-epimerase [Aurantimonas sp. MSK8Z-1]|uniref:dTDP-4-dehydrorhamnose 3,5-epimerase n=1 Tax=Mangrovibrevibacter kandeliae TaxID=2968473 RepID=UPI00211884CB|nr:dTDP-4-dehydrorhamnose 3,5-epimerase [Aurantimonas sp. MSK8Z-1]MCW4116991.1 dTDP-4-dehydrorhamnose 3,5-epimerase [Aurantimonas sp. MSK8Z-1]